MRYKKVLLFRADPRVTFAVTLLPIGLGILSEQLERIGVEHDVYYMVLNNETEALLQKIEFGAREFQRLPPLVHDL